MKNVDISHISNAKILSRQSIIHVRMSEWIKEPDSKIALRVPIYPKVLGTNGQNGNIERKALGRPRSQEQSGHAGTYPTPNRFFFDKNCFK